MQKQHWSFDPRISSSYFHSPPSPLSLKVVCSGIRFYSKLQVRFFSTLAKWILWKQLQFWIVRIGNFSVTLFRQQAAIFSRPDEKQDELWTRSNPFFQRLRWLESKHPHLEVGSPVAMVATRENPQFILQPWNCTDEIGKGYYPFFVFLSCWFQRLWAKRKKPICFVSFEISAGQNVFKQRTLFFSPSHSVFAEDRWVFLCFWGKIRGVF